MRTLRLLAFAAALGASFLAPRSAGQASFNILYRFSGSAGIQEPWGVIAGPNGVLYGMTPGPYGGYGSVYELQRAPAATHARWKMD
jgi:hypothetical protein